MYILKFEFNPPHLSPLVSMLDLDIETILLYLFSVLFVFVSSGNGFR